MDNNFKIIGHSDIIGKFFSPQMPWARTEYYFPEHALSKFTQKALVQEPPSLGFFLGSETYAYLLNKAGIASITNLSALDSATIRSKLQESANQEGLSITAPSINEIASWKDVLAHEF